MVECHKQGRRLLESPAFLTRRCEEIRSDARDLPNTDWGDNIDLLRQTISNFHFLTAITRAKFSWLDDLPVLFAFLCDPTKAALVAQEDDAGDAVENSGLPLASARPNMCLMACPMTDD